ncbi:MAG: hypothetical protein ABR530_03755 [Pyrinomonadaceae bacterium]
MTIAYALATLSYAGAGYVAAQSDGPELAPPPIRLMSKDERLRLDGVSDIKSRTKLALELMNARVTAAEKLHATEDFEGVFRELGGFHGVMDNCVQYLVKRDSGSGKVLDNFKRLDLGLRALAPRLESIRRELPLRYEDYVRRLIRYVREARTTATEPFFSDTVVPHRPGN